MLKGFVFLFMGLIALVLFQGEIALAGPMTEQAIATGDALEVPSEERVNWVRIWHLDNSTKKWTFWDSRLEYADVGSLRTIISDQIYWISVRENQAAVFFGTEYRFYVGWNLIPFGG